MGRSLLIEYALHKTQVYVLSCQNFHLNLNTTIIRIIIVQVKFILSRFIPDILEV